MQKGLEEQVAAGQEALGRLIRQFLAVNGFKHVQFMHMAQAVMGVRWIHSSQISTLKQGGTKNITSFPLYAIACVNRRIYQINNDLAKAPQGTARADWVDKQAMLRPDGQPLDVGDLWRIYFGGMEAPLFTNGDIDELDEVAASKLSQNLHQLYVDYCQQQEQEPMSYLTTAMSMFPGTEAQWRQLKGVLLGVVDLDPEDAIGLSEKSLCVFLCSSWERDQQATDSGIGFWAASLLNLALLTRRNPYCACPYVNPWALAASFRLL